MGKKIYIRWGGGGGLCFTVFFIIWHEELGTLILLNCIHYKILLYMLKISIVELGTHVEVYLMKIYAAIQKNYIDYKLLTTH